MVMLLRSVDMSLSTVWCNANEKASERHYMGSFLMYYGLIEA